MSPPLLPQDITMTSETETARDLLGELVAIVRGECPRLLNEDSGGSAELSMRIDAALSRAPEALELGGSTRMTSPASRSQTPLSAGNDRGQVGRVMDALWPILGGNHMPGEAWVEINTAVADALSPDGRLREIADAVAKVRPVNVIHGKKLIHVDDDETGQGLFSIPTRYAAYADLLWTVTHLAALSPPSTGGVLTGDGFVYHNPDVGTEYAPSHPVESGEVPDATDVRASTPFEDWLVRDAAVNRPTSTSTGGAIKRTMTINLTDEEMAALEALAKAKDMEPPTIFRHALRLYQVSHDEAVNGPIPRGPLGSPSPEMGADDLWDALKRQCCATKPNSEHWDEVSTLVTVRRSDIEAAVSKLKENGLSREELGGSARASRGAAGPSDCAENDAPSQGGEPITRRSNTCGECLHIGENSSMASDCFYEEAANRACEQFELVVRQSVSQTVNDEMLAALRGLESIMGSAESNASGNPEWERVSSRGNAARAAIAKASANPTDGSDAQERGPVPPLFDGGC